MIVWKFRPCYEPDGVSGGTEETPSEAGETATEEASEAEENPWKGSFISQTSQEFREKYKDQLLQMRGKSLTDTMEELLTTRDTLSRAIIPPSKDAKPEEIKAFLKKMDIPEKPEEYGFDKKLFGEADKDGAFTASLAKDMHTQGFTKKQGKWAAEKLSAIIKAGNEHTENVKKEAALSFDTRLVDALGEEKAKNTREHFKRYLVSMSGGKESGKAFIQKLAETGLLYDTDFVTRAAEYHRATTTEAPYVDGNRGGNSTNKKIMAHSDQFENEYGRR